MLNALTFDVEDYYHVTALAEAVPREKWELMPRRVEANTARLLELLSERQTRATFFVLGWVAERIPGLVRQIVAAGHEIACHGYSHRLVYQQSREEFQRETALAKSILEDQAQVRVRGYRAATYSIVHRSIWALDVLAELGFEYDSSIFPVRHDLYGIPGAERAPHRRVQAGGRTIVEFPLSTVSLGSHRLPVAGGGYFRILPFAVTCWAVRRVNGEGLPFIFYLHPWELDPGQPRIRVGLRSRMRHYTNLGRCEKRLRRLIREFSFSTVSEVLDQVGPLPVIAGRGAAA